MYNMHNIRALRPEFEVQMVARWQRDSTC